MIRHIVIWKLDDSYSTEEKITIKKQLNDRLTHLIGKIEQIRQFELNFNSEKASDSNFDIMLDSDFESFEDLKKYQVHPEHMKVADYLKTLKLKRASIDYEY